MRVAQAGDTTESAERATKWPLVPLKDVCDVNPRRRSDLRRADDAPVSFIPMTAVDAQTGSIGQRLERPFSEVKKGFTYFEDGDVIFAKITPCMQNGKSAVCAGLLNGFGFGSTEFHVLRPYTILRSEWLHYFLRQPQLLRDAEEHFTGAVGQQRVPENYLAGLEIPLPTVAEQEQVAGHLTHSLAAVDAARRAAADRLAAAEALPAAYLREVFEAQAWPVRELRELCRTITDGTHLPPPFTDAGIPFLFVRNIVAGIIDFDVEKYISEETYRHLTKKHKAERGDVLFSAVGSFGVAVVVRTNTRFVFQRHIAHIKPDATRLDPEFLAFFLNSPGGRSQSEAVAMGGAQRTVTLADLRKFRIPLPPLDQQHRVAADLSRRLQAAGRIAGHCREELTAVDALPAALLRAAFNGDS